MCPLPAALPQQGVVWRGRAKPPPSTRSVLVGPFFGPFRVGRVGFRVHGGADYLDKIESAADTDTALAEMMDWCIEHRCYSFFRLSNYARTQRTDWFRVITSRRTVYLTAWLKSMEWEAQKGTLDEAVECFQHHEGHEQHHEQHDEQHEQHAAKCCPICGSDNVKRNGKTAADVQRYQCNDCGKTFV